MLHEPAVISTATVISEHLPCETQCHAISSGPANRFGHPPIGTMECWIGSWITFFFFILNSIYMNGWNQSFSSWPPLACQLAPVHLFVFVLGFWLNFFPYISLVRTQIEHNWVFDDKQYWLVQCNLVNQIEYLKIIQKKKKKFRINFGLCF